MPITAALLAEAVERNGGGAVEPAPVHPLGRNSLFFFFSNRLGCTSSLLITGLGTLLLLWLMGWLSF